MAESAARVDVSMECSSAGWKKPVGEQYPAEGFLDRLVAKGVTFTTASDAHGSGRVGERAGDLADMLEARGVHELASYTQSRASDDSPPSELVATLAELAAQRTRLDEPAIDHL